MTGFPIQNTSKDQPDPIRERFDALVDEAQELIDSLSVLSGQQRHAIEGGDVAQIVEAVAQREPVVRAIVRVGEELAAFIEDPKALAGIDEQHRTQALLRIAGIEHAMKRLRERDAQDQQQMERTRTQLARQLAGMGAGKTALRAYSSRSQTPDPIMQDREG